MRNPNDNAQDDTVIELPIDRELPGIRRAVEGHPCVVIEAPPGTGKTSRVAPFLMSGDVQQKTVLIQPRRIAARSAARRIAVEAGDQLGGRIGYQVRFDQRCGPETELVCMTPGILLRRLQSDPVVSDIRTIILDEFHERSIEMDLLLGLLRQLQIGLRPELRLVLMSATLEMGGVLEFLREPAVVSVESPHFPVDVQYSPFRFQPGRSRPTTGLPRQIAEATAATVKKAVSTHPGDCLVFLPGVGEIRRVHDLLAADAKRNDWQLMSLYGDMRPADQDAVLGDCDGRKIVLATNIAETSLTIDGIRVVVDSGYARVQRYSSASGLDALELERISMASAKQRAGRAGRTAPGVCYRMWDQASERGRKDHLEPEIHRVDLAGPLLYLLAQGERDPAKFPWLSAPADHAIEQALQLLTSLDAIREGVVTDVGRTMLQFPLHPRLSRLLIAGHELGVPQWAATAAAILSERDILSYKSNDRSTSRSVAPVRPGHDGSAGQECDVSYRVALLEALQGSRRPANDSVDRSAAEAVRRVVGQLVKIMDSTLGECTADAEESPQWALLAAFPDRLCKRREPGKPKGLMVGGKGVRLEEQSCVHKADLFLAINVDGRGSEARVRLATGVESYWLPGNRLQERLHRFFNKTTGAINTRERVLWGDLVIQETPVETPGDLDTARLLAREAAQRLSQMMPKDKSLNQFLARVAWLRQEMPELELVLFDADTAADVLAPYCVGLKSLQEVRKLDWTSIVRGTLDYPQQQLLASHAPEWFALPSGRKVFLQYEPGRPPVLAARIQEFFGMTHTPAIAGGKVPLLLHLLAPNQRCQQITDDLASFWKNTYAQVRKDLRGRYPKHAWPEDPMNPQGG